MMMKKENIKIGTCSWNYDSWISLVYSKPQSRSVNYLKEYSRKYRTVEIDSWFYKMPSREEAAEYASQVDGGFTFACKLFEQITLTHKRQFSKSSRLEVNPFFLSGELFSQYCKAIEPIVPQLEGIQCEFEYLNKSKMASLDIFLQKLDYFFSSIKTDIPIFIETRNSNYLSNEYFDFLKKHKLGHVLSEKQYMPPVYDVYEKFQDKLGDTIMLRLLGGDRKSMEEKTKEVWNTIAEERADLPRIADMVADISKSGRKIRIYVNNHFEGSSPLTIGRLAKLINKKE